ncbi:MAG: tetratricopeptide repeat protein [Hyphomonadaceae bacterium]
MLRFLCLSFAVIVMPLTAYAQVLILGGGAGQDCYQAVKFNLFPSARHERICTEAIEAGALDRKNLAGTYINRGIIRMRMQSYEAALGDYAKAERLTPNSGPLHLNKGAALIGARDFDTALISLNQAIALETQDPHAAHYNLGLAYEHLGQADLAYQSYQTALELRPDWSLPTKALERFTVTRE